MVHKFTEFNPNNSANKKRLKSDVLLVISWDDYEVFFLRRTIGFYFESDLTGNAVEREGKVCMTSDLSSVVNICIGQFSRKDFKNKLLDFISQVSRRLASHSGNVLN